MATPRRVKEKDRTRFVGSPTDQTQRSKCSSKSEVSKKELTCSVCLDSLKDPKLLPCLHTYCKECLQGILRKSREKSSIKCPQCRSVHAIPSGGVDEFPSDMVSANALDFHSLKDREKITQSIPCGMCTEDDPVMTHCPTCSKFLCEFCSKAHKRQVDYRDHKTVSLDDLDSETLKGFERSRRCSRHSGELLKLYCKTCRKLICRDCTLVDHHNHTFGFSKDVRPDIQKQVESSVAVLGMKRKELETHLKFTNDIEKSRKDHSNGLERELNHAFDSYITTVESRRKKLLEQERKAKDRDLKQIWAQKEFIEMKLASIDGSMRYANRLCSCPSDLDMLEMSGEATQQLSNLSELEWNPTSQLQLSAPLVFSAITGWDQDVVGNVNPVSLQYCSISISNADSTSVQSTSQQCEVQYGLQSTQDHGVPAYGLQSAQIHGLPRPAYSLQSAQIHGVPRPAYGLQSAQIYGVPRPAYGLQSAQIHGVPRSAYGRQSAQIPRVPACGLLSAQDCGVQYGFKSRGVPLVNQTDIIDYLNVELGKAVQLVVHLSHSPASVSSSLIIPSISVTTEYSTASSANYVVLYHDDSSWMITVKPLHGGTYYVKASLCQHPVGNESEGVAIGDDPQTFTFSSAVANSQYTFTVIGTPKIGARVRRGPNWPQGNNEDGGIGNRGTVIHPYTKQHPTPQPTVDDPFGNQYLTQQPMPMGDVYVEWDNGNKNVYQWGSGFPIELVPY